MDIMNKENDFSNDDEILEMIEDFIEEVIPEENR